MQLTSSICRIITCMVLITGLILGTAIPANAKDFYDNSKVKAEESQDKKEIYELTNEAETECFDGYTVKLSNKMDKETEKDIKRSDDSEKVTDDYVSVDNPTDALDFADPEDIEYIEPNYYLTLDDSHTDNSNKAPWELEFPLGKPNDPGYGSWIATSPAIDDGPNYGGSTGDSKKYYTFELNQWNLDLVNAPYAWQKGYRGNGVVVGVIDSGLWTGLNDIDYSKVLAGRSFMDGDDTSYTEDYKGHGSRVTSVFLSSVNNGVGYAGITDQSNLMPIKLKVGSNNKVTGENFIKGFEYARKKGVDVVNISMGMYYDYQPLEDQINLYALEGGITVAPVGNHNSKKYRYPASYSNVIGVGGVDSTGNRWVSSSTSGSNRNSSVYVVAPAKDVPVISMKNSQMTTATGCSYAVPHVVAMAIIAKQYSKGKINITEFKRLLKSTSTDKGTPGKDNYYGYGLINFGKFIDSMTKKNTNGSAEVIPYHITYAKKGGKFKGTYKKFYTGKKKTKLPTNIKRFGYSFKGWYTKPGSSGKKKTVLAKGTKGNKKFYAKWTLGKYKLKFKTGKTVRLKTKSKMVTYSKKIGKLPKPKRKGYKFMGWYTKSGARYTASKKYRLGSNKTLYAKWKKVK